MNFITNDLIEGTGWSIEYVIGGCGGYVKDRNGDIDAYAHNLDGLVTSRANCTWVLETEDSTKVVQLKDWKYFHVNYSPKCDQDRS